jgi:hypothetical protein
MGVACQQQRARGGKIFPVREERVAPENLGTINPSCGKFRAGFSSYSLTRVRTVQENLGKFVPICGTHNASTACYMR